MKLAWLILLGIALGAVGYRGFQHWRSPTPLRPLVAVSEATSAPLSEAAGGALPMASRDVQHGGGVVPGLPPQTIAVDGAASVGAAAPVTPADTSPALHPDTLAIPVQGITAAQLTDTFTDARSQGRTHDAIDIMAASGTPVLAVADGRVEKLFSSERGGLTVYQFEPSGRFAYYYAHLDRYAEGLGEGQTLRRGQLIGYVGSTGNASADAPHLHFAVFALGPERHWWEGQAINPYPLLRGAPLP
jgi:murein DD-endopeptidase MepM/ murein hydrolase activator NlpD